MKKVLVMLVLLLGLTAPTYSQNFEKHGTEFVQTKTTRTKSEPEKTTYTWKDSKGNVYPIYISNTGSCFVLKVSAKTGKEYRYYLGKEISAAICKELGREYSSRK